LKPLSIYPSEAASQIKRALYYASRGEVSDMANAFKEAIQAAEKSGMHPLSDEVAGLKIECANLLLKVKDGQYATKAVEVLEHVLDEAAAGAEYFEKQSRWKDRSKVLKRAVLLGYKIGEIYQMLGKDDKAEEAMSWATEMLLKETGRRAESKTPDDNNDDDWFDNAASSACFESTSQAPALVTRRNG
jgi:tetratricopeptide (TPR) repeat protein